MVFLAGCHLKGDPKGASIAGMTAVRAVVPELMPWDRIDHTAGPGAEACFGMVV